MWTQPREAARWAEIRQRGFTNYLLLRGGLACGGLMALWIAGFVRLFGPVWRSMPPASLALLAGCTLAASWIVGLLCAWHSWWAREARFLHMITFLHRCPCGYSLIGNVSGRCPECGRAS